MLHAARHAPRHSGPAPSKGLQQHRLFRRPPPALLATHTCRLLATPDLTDRRGQGIRDDGRCVAFGLTNPKLGTEELFAVAEVETEGDLASAALVSQEISAAISSELGVSLRQLFLKPRGWLVKSTAGKPARSTTREKLLAEHHELAAQHNEWRLE